MEMSSTVHHHLSFLLLFCFFALKQWIGFYTWRKLVSSKLNFSQPTKSNWFSSNLAIIHVLHFANLIFNVVLVMGFLQLQIANSNSTTSSLQWCLNIPNDLNYDLRTLTERIANRSFPPRIENSESRID